MQRVLEIIRWILLTTIWFLVGVFSVLGVVHGIGSLNDEPYGKFIKNDDDASRMILFPEEFAEYGEEKAKQELSDYKEWKKRNYTKAIIGILSPILYIPIGFIFHKLFNRLMVITHYHAGLK
jgi:hypothetical protein